ncbi:UDP-galactopyranose mutase [Lactococcus protaetiae]|uniref:UDP-galactopyranose mutase n=1 Tax=Lactococcus protaetiae TaxID=2592653 RepID=UPI003CCA2D5E
MKYNTKNYDYLIVGAGPFGSVFAYEAAKRGKRSLVIDKRLHIGGNMFTHKEHGINIHDYGAHIFHTNDERIWNYVNQFTEFMSYTNQVLANYKGELYNLPFNMNTFYQMWGVKTPREAKDKIFEQKSVAEISKNPKNLEEQAIALIGTDIYKKLIKGYTEKQWGRKATELPAFIIRRLPVRYTFDNNYFDDRYQGIPIDGYTQIFNKMLQSELIDVQMGVDFFHAREEYLEEFPRIVYTGMIDQFFDYKFGELEYRSICFESQVFESDNMQGNAVINYTDSETPFTRVMEWRHFDKRAEGGYTVLTKEYPQKWDKTKEAYYPINDKKIQRYLKNIEEKLINIIKLFLEDDWEITNTMTWIRFLMQL